MFGVFVSRWCALCSSHQQREYTCVFHCRCPVVLCQCQYADCYVEEQLGYLRNCLLQVRNSHYFYCIGYFLFVVKQLDVLCLHRLSSLCWVESPHSFEQIWDQSLRVYMDNAVAYVFMQCQNFRDNAKPARHHNASEKRGALCWRAGLAFYWLAPWRFSDHCGPKILTFCFMYLHSFLSLYMTLYVHVDVCTGLRSLQLFFFN